MGLETFYGGRGNYAKSETGPSQYNFAAFITFSDPKELGRAIFFSSPECPISGALSRNFEYRREVW